MDNKKLGIIGGIILVVLLIVGASITPKDKTNSTKNITNNVNDIVATAEKESEEASNDPTKQKEFTEINVSKYMEYYTGSEAKLVLVARPTCHYCQIAEPILHKIAYEYNIEINYLNTDNFVDDDASTFMHSNEQFSEGFGTPMLMSVSNSQINDMVDGLTDYSHYVEFLKNNNFVE